MTSDGERHRVTPQGTVARSNYVFRLYLPGRSGVAVGESSASDRVFSGVVDTDLAETTWCCYAWPADYGRFGGRTFVIDQDGAVLATEDPDYSGANGPPPGAAFLDAGPDRITGRRASGGRGQDGNHWRRVNRREHGFRPAPSGARTRAGAEARQRGSLRLPR